MTTMLFKQSQRIVWINLEKSNFPDTRILFDNIPLTNQDTFYTFTQVYRVMPLRTLDFL